MSITNARKASYLRKSLELAFGQVESRYDLSQSTEKAI